MKTDLKAFIEINKKFVLRFSGVLSFSLTIFHTIFPKLCIGNRICAKKKGMFGKVCKKLAPLSFIPRSKINLR